MRYIWIPSSKEWECSIFVAVDGYLVGSIYRDVMYILGTNIL
jgi:hypothetical protein